MNTKHTPGPWTVSPTKHRTLIVSAQGFHVAALDEASPEDARLIAASADLLAALQAVVDCADEGPNLAGTAERFARYDAAFKAARAAISKVTA